MKKKCRNHPERNALSICHNCNGYYCKECLNEGQEYYYCNNELCNSKYLEETNKFIYNPAEDIGIPKIKKIGWGWILLLGLIFSAIGQVYHNIGDLIGVLYLIGIITGIPIYFYFRNKVLRVTTSAIFHSLKAGLISYLITAVIVAIVANLIKRL